MVRHEAVDLLRHRPVERPQTRFDVADRDVELGTDEGRRGRRVYVPIDEDEVRPIGQELLFELHHRLRRLDRVGAGADAEVDIGLGEAQLMEEHVGHVRVVVLACMDEPLRHPFALGEGSEHWRGFHKVGPGTNDVDDLHRFLYDYEF